MGFIWCLAHTHFSYLICKSCFGLGDRGRVSNECNLIANLKLFILQLHSEGKKSYIESIDASEEWISDVRKHAEIAMKNDRSCIGMKFRVQSVHFCSSSPASRAARGAKSDSTHSNFIMCSFHPFSILLFDTDRVSNPSKMRFWARVQFLHFCSLLGACAF